MIIKKTSGEIIEIKDLSKTAKEINIKLDEALDYIAGSFVNVFMEINGEKTRRAYSISSYNKETNVLSLSIRLSPNGKMSPTFWNKNMIGEKLELMGTLGLNTVDKMHSENIYLFGFGIGAGVIKSIAEHFSNNNQVKKIVIITGSRSEDEIIYRDFFDELSKVNPKIHTEYIISQPKENTPFKKGYIQDHISGFNFDDSDIYVCGQEIACNTLVEKIKQTNPNNCNFLIEGFH